MTGNIRSWLHFLDVRDDEHSQKEVRLIAQKIREQLTPHIPNTMKAYSVHRTTQKFKNDLFKLVLRERYNLEQGSTKSVRYISEVIEDYANTLEQI